MRLSRIVPVTLVLLSALAPVAHAEPPRERVLATGAAWSGAAPFCLTGNTCTIKMQVRDGERYLHVVVKGSSGPAALDVLHGEGVVTRVCYSTAAPLPISGTAVVFRVVHDPACSAVPAVEGRLIAFFAERAVTLNEAIQYAEADPTRKVAGGV